MMEANYFSEEEKEEEVDEISRLRIELRLERLEHTEKRRRLNESEARARELEVEVKRLKNALAVLRNERSSQIFRDHYMESIDVFFFDIERQSLAATSRSWRMLVFPGNLRREAIHRAQGPSGWLVLAKNRRIRSVGLVPFFRNELSVARKSQTHYFLNEINSEDEDISDEDEDDTSGKSVIAHDERIDLEAIELDLRRTHEETEIEALRYVLLQVCAAAPARPAYCQGMNFVAAFILRQVDGDSTVATQIFCRLYQALDLDSVYCERKEMAGLKLLLYQLEHLLKTHLPVLAHHLNKLDLRPFLYATSWIVTLLVNFLPEEDALTAMDEVITAISCAETLPPPPWDLNDASNLDEKSTHFETSATARGWAIIFRIILIALSEVAAEIIELDFDGTLRFLQDFATVFAKRNISISCLLKNGAGTELEREKSLISQLAELRDQFRISDFDSRAPIPPSPSASSYQQKKNKGHTSPVSRRLAGAAARVARQYAKQVRSTLPRSPMKYSSSPSSSIMLLPLPARRSSSPLLSSSPQQQQQEKEEPDSPTPSPPRQNKNLHHSQISS